MPEFWTNHAHRIRRSDEIRIEWDDGRGLARGCVRDVSAVGTNMSRAVVHILESIEFDAMPRTPGHVATHAVEYRGPHLKHVIIRLADGQIAADGFETPQAAAQAFENIVRRDKVA